MALTGIQIFKLLPKTNCGECGVPTCLAFAMNLAAAKAELDSCPYVSDEAREKAVGGLCASYQAGGHRCRGKGAETRRRDRHVQTRKDLLQPHRDRRSG